MPGYAAISSNLYGTSAGTVKMAMALAANPLAELGQTAVTLASGANTIAVPPWAAGMIITPPTTNTQAMILKGVGGDTGITISPTLPLLIGFPATPPASFVINSAGLQSAVTVITFF